ncbi:DUF4179 domain-containing protein [Peribacillus sp. SCS-37]|uniref:DUF4179 domain-containing protein n=1 Tax=Paraperibacillus esterisolvens TaxID=3115296 RepID=UPI003905C083
MNNIKQEIDRIKIPKGLHERAELGVQRAKMEQKEMRGLGFNRKRNLYKRLAIAAAVCLLVLSALTYTPVLAAIQKAVDKIFSSGHIDDGGLKTAVSKGHGQIIDQTFYDQQNDITVHFESIMTDDKETKLLFTYQSKRNNLKNYYIDIFEGKSSISLVKEGTKTKLNHVGWGSRYYDRKQNKVAEALSFDSIKKMEGQPVKLEIENLTIYGGRRSGMAAAKWPLSFQLGKTGISDRQNAVLNKSFTFGGETYLIKQVEFSDLETRVVVSGTDTKKVVENGEKYDVMSKLESQLLNARKFDKEHGYTYNGKKSGVVLMSDGVKAVPIFSKGEVEGKDDEYIMSFEPVKNRRDCILEVGNKLRIPLAEDR